MKEEEEEEQEAVERRGTRDFEQGKGQGPSIGRKKDLMDGAEFRRRRMECFERQKGKTVVLVL